MHVISKFDWFSQLQTHDILPLRHNAVCHISQLSEKVHKVTCKRNELTVAAGTCEHQLVLLALILGFLTNMAGTVGETGLHLLHSDTLTVDTEMLFCPLA
jgi:hypothetical protein